MTQNRRKPFADYAVIRGSVYVIREWPALIFERSVIGVFECSTSALEFAQGDLRLFGKQQERYREKLQVSFLG